MPEKYKATCLRDWWATFLIAPCVSRVIYKAQQNSHCHMWLLYMLVTCDLNTCMSAEIWYSLPACLCFAKVAEGKYFPEMSEFKEVLNAAWWGWWQNGPWKESLNIELRVKIISLFSAVKYRSFSLQTYHWLNEIKK